MLSDVVHLGFILKGKELISQSIASVLHVCPGVHMFSPLFTGRGDV